MLKALARLLGKDATSGRQPPEQHRRIYQRRANDLCVSVIDGKLFPVENWSMGGLLLAGDARMFGVNQFLDLTLKFRLREQILDITQKARIVRKSEDKFALEFMDIPASVKSKLQHVIDDALMSALVGAPA